MRARNIKPSITKNEDLADIPFEARLLFVYLPMMADAEGRLEDRPRRIHAELFPYDLDLNINQLLDFLVAAGFIIRYKLPEPLPNDNGTTSGFIWIFNFTKHQHPHKQERDSGSVIPPYDQKIHISTFNGTNSEPLPNDNGSTREESPILSPDSPILSPDSPTQPAPVVEPITIIQNGKAVTPTAEKFQQAEKVLNYFSEKIKPTSSNSAVTHKILECLSTMFDAHLLIAIDNQTHIYEVEETPDRFKKGWRSFFDVEYIKLLLSGRLKPQSAVSAPNDKNLTDAQKKVKKRLEELRNKENKHE